MSKLPESVKHERRAEIANSPYAKYFSDIGFFMVWNGSQTVTVYSGMLEEINVHSISYDPMDFLEEEYNGGEDPPRKIQDLGVDKAREIVYESMEELRNMYVQEFNHSIDEY